MYITANYKLGQHQNNVSLWERSNIIWCFEGGLLNPSEYRHMGREFSQTVIHLLRVAEKA